MAEICRIEFEDSPSKVVYAGQILKGIATINIKQNTLIRGIYLRIEGKAFCMKQTYQRESTHFKNPRGVEKYLDERIVCYDGTKHLIQLAAGEHRYDFECQLASVLPTSLDEKHGHIRYTISVRFNESWDEPPIHEELFTIIKPLNLNHFTNLHEPFSLEHKQRFSIWCCCPCIQSQPIKITGRLPQQGYAPGQYIDLQFNIHNKSSEDIQVILVQIVKKVKYTFNKSGNKTLSDRMVLTELAIEGFKRKHAITKTHKLKINIPSTPPTTDDTTKSILRVQYRIRIRAVVSFCHNDSILDLPFTVGTSPIQNQHLKAISNGKIKETNPNDDATESTTAPLLKPSTSFAADETAEIIQSIPLRPFYSGRDSPIYVQAVNENYSGESFKPKYPVYQLK